MDQNRNNRMDVLHRQIISGGDNFADELLRTVFINIYIYYPLMYNIPFYVTLNGGFNLFYASICPRQDGRTWKVRSIGKLPP